jgi:hypothetical protein
MKVIKKYEILNSEGPIMILHEHSDHLSMEFNGSRVHTIVEPREVLAFLLGKGSITNEDRVYHIDNYTEGEIMQPEKMSELIKNMWEKDKGNN